MRTALLAVVLLAGCSGSTFGTADPQLDGGPVVPEPLQTQEAGTAAASASAAPSTDAVCYPQTCASLHWECGTAIPDGCGHTLNCGPCAPRPVASAPSPPASAYVSPPLPDAGTPTEAGAVRPDAGHTVCVTGLGCCGPDGMFGCYMPPNTTDSVIACCSGYGVQRSTGGYCGPIPDSGVCL